MSSFDQYRDDRQPLPGLVLNGSAIERQTSGAAGYDLCSSTTVTIPPQSNAVVGTGTHVALPPGTYGAIESRSGLAFKLGAVVDGHQTYQAVTAFRGIIDSDYRGEIKVLLFNHGVERVRIPAGSRICQLVVHKYETVNFVPASSLPATERGDHGFGSTGGVNYII